MYKIYIKYFGELVDKISGTDGSGDCAENYELGEEYICKNEEDLKKEVNRLIKEGIDRDFVIDENTTLETNKIIELVQNNGKEIIRLFYGKEENWNCYYELVLEKLDRVAVYGIEFERISIINELIRLVNEEFQKQKKEFIETQNDIMIAELSLLQETMRYLDNEKTKNNISIGDWRVVNKDISYFVDEIVAIYYNSDLGNSYEDIELIIKEFIREFKEVEEE